MNYHDPFRNYDAWVTRDPFYDAQSAELEAWDDFVDRRNRPTRFTEEGTMLLGRSSSSHLMALVPPEACEEDHPDHAIYEAWLELEDAINRRADRLMYEDMESSDKAAAEYEALKHDPF